MLPSYLDHIYVHLKQKARLRAELSTKILSTLGSNPARTRREKPGPTYSSGAANSLSIYSKLQKRSSRLALVDDDVDTHPIFVRQLQVDQSITHTLFLSKIIKLIKNNNTRENQWLRDWVLTRSLRSGKLVLESCSHLTFAMKQVTNVIEQRFLYVHSITKLDSLFQSKY